METTTVDQLRGDILADAMRKLQANPRSLPEGYYSATVEPDFGMLVEPVNGHTFVFVLPNTVHRFESQPGSGTDKLRKRIEAGLFFKQMLDQRPIPQPAYSPVKGDRIEVRLKGAASAAPRVGQVDEVRADGSFFVNGEGYGSRFHATDLASNDLFEFRLLERPVKTRRAKP
jgi:hypothetical protein